MDELQAACLVRVPTEVIKTRMQTASYGHLAQSSFSAAKLVLSQEGLWGFYRGFGITVMREVSVLFVRMTAAIEILSLWL